MRQKGVGGQEGGNIPVSQLLVLVTSDACCRPVNVPQPVGVTDPEMAARLECINHLVALLPDLQSQTQRHATQSHQGNPALLAGQQPALAEDWQLRGFLPLQQCHDRLTFEKQEACHTLTSAIHVSIRLCSLLGAG